MSTQTERLAWTQWFAFAKFDRFVDVEQLQRGFSAGWNAALAGVGSSPAPEVEWGDFTLEVRSYGNETPEFTAEITNDQLTALWAWLRDGCPLASRPALSQELREQVVLMLRRIDGDYVATAERLITLLASSPAQPDTQPTEACGTCGGRQVVARPRYPGTEPRIVCPTCLADRIANIAAIADRNYGVAAAAPKEEHDE